MIIQTLSNKSVVVMSDMPHEAATVASFRQFAVGDKIMCDSRQRTILDVATVVCDDGLLHNLYSYYNRDEMMMFEVKEIDLLHANPRSCPANIFDTLVDYLPVMAKE